MRGFGDFGFLAIAAEALGSGGAAETLAEGSHRRVDDFGGGAERVRAACPAG